MSQSKKSSTSACRKSARAGCTALTISAAGCTLIYVFVLLVPQWRETVTDRRTLLDRLRLWDNASEEAWRLMDGVRLRSRSSNLFRECLWDSDELNATVWRRWRDAHDDVNATIGAELDWSDESDGRCWLVDLRWGEGLNSSERSQMTLILCLRALFILAILLLCCQFVVMVTSLYTCFASGLSRCSCLVLCTTHCLCLCLLVSVVILQDASTRAEFNDLQQLLRRLFPQGCESAVTVTTGLCTFVILCLLVGLCCLQLLLLLFVWRATAAAGDAACECDAAGSNDEVKKVKEEEEEDEQHQQQQDTSPLIM